MKLDDFGYDLPHELIAQYPCIERGASRMMVARRKSGTVERRLFSDLPEFVEKDTVIVINDTMVIPARLIGKKTTGGMIEILLLSRISEKGSPGETWEALIRPARRVRTGARIFFGEDGEAEITERMSEKKWLVTFSTGVPFDEFFSRHGRMPLPPYIKRDYDSAESSLDIERYQTIYARYPGSVAAPTAGLHFSRHMLDSLERKGVHVVPVTLHVGYGTFLPIEKKNVEDHRMEEEFFNITPEAAEEINAAGKVIAVGTTSTRVIESVADETGRVKACSGSTGLFIYPGYSFKRINSLVTNFHLPKSSLYLLACAFAGRRLMEAAYREAIRNRFLFYSYGDCMLIL